MHVLISAVEHSSHSPVSKLQRAATPFRPSSPAAAISAARSDLLLPLVLLLHDSLVHFSPTLPATRAGKITQIDALTFATRNVREKSGLKLL